MANDSNDQATGARRLWTLIEPIHAVTYFSDASRDALAAAGFKGFWMGYFAARSAPLGAAATPAVVESTFFGFARSHVERSLPDAWTFATPEAALDARSRSAVIALRQAVPDLDEHVRRALPLLESAAHAARCDGRLLALSNQRLPQREDPVERLWQATTTLREHRGDGHVAALIAGGLGGIESLVLASKMAAGAADALHLRAARGWTESEWNAAIDRLVAQGLLDDDHRPTATGTLAHARVEYATDEAAVQPFRDGLTESGLSLLSTVLRPIAAGARSILPFPNPIGLPNQ
ncbi:MAG: hypothetical protein GX868_11715 [Actinobacteria bacterium]|nr:hypothetical protein [Actinomycetota bacterium]